jgi:DNA gyrase subunit B/topoisomerase-4 subunit B
VLELLIVEGESAGLAVQRVADASKQQVLAMQGKPLNAWKATRARVESNSLFRAVIDQMGCSIGDDFQREDCRFERTLLLFDPDADGIHAAALMGWFFHRWMPGLIPAGRIWVVHPPRGEMTAENGEHRLYDSDAEAAQIASRWQAQGLIQIEKTPFRGLASLNSDVLARTCVTIETRRARALRTEDIEASRRIFGGARGG